MRFGNKTLALLALLCGSAVQANGDEANDDKGPLQIGEHFPIRLSSQESDSSINSSVTGKGSKTYTIHHPGASYIAVHFANIDLDPSCSMEISDANGEQRTVMRGRGRQDLGTFWARHIEGEIMEVTLKCNGNNKKADFVIDDYVAGYPKDHHTTEERKRNLRAQDPFAQDLSRDLSICDTDDKENAKCYQTSHQVEYGKAKAVARLIINGSGGCTGWLVGPNNVLLTNEHCISSNSDAQNTDYQFMYEGASCGSNSVSGVSTFDGLNLLKDNYAKDYALVQLSGNPVDTFGYLDIENRLPSPGEVVYIPQHAGARDKEIGIFDTKQGSNARCTVLTTSSGACRGGGAYSDVRYTCDTEGGSSGSPVISATNNKVIALHHCGAGCNGNLGVPVVQFYNEIVDLIYGTSPPPQNDPPTSAPNPQPTSPPSCTDKSFALKLKTDNVASETSWVLKNSNGVVEMQGSGYQNDSEYYITGCVEDGQHTFTINDSRGDGICCGYGRGSYEVKYDGTVVKTGGTFTNTESVTFGGPNPPPPTCTDDANWSYRQGKKNYGCSYLASKPNKCGQRGNDGRTGRDACECSC